MTSFVISQVAAILLGKSLLKRQLSRELSDGDLDAGQCDEGCEG